MAVGEVRVLGRVEIVGDEGATRLSAKLPDCWPPCSSSTRFSTLS
jgi:hypothetical protein